MEGTRRQLILALTLGILTTGGGCLSSEKEDIGSLRVSNDSELPQLVHITPKQYPNTVPDPVQRLSTSVYVEPGESKYYEDFIEFPGEYGLKASLKGGDSDVEIRQFEFTEEEGTVSGYAIEFTVQADGDLSWSLSSQEGSLNKR